MLQEKTSLMFVRDRSGFAVITTFGMFVLAAVAIVVVMLLPKTLHQAAPLRIGLWSVVLVIHGLIALGLLVATILFFALAKSSWNDADEAISSYRNFGGQARWWRFFVGWDEEPETVDVTVLGFEDGMRKFRTIIAHGFRLELPGGRQECLIIPERNMQPMAWRPKKDARERALLVQRHFRILFFFIPRTEIILIGPAPPPP